MESIERIEVIHKKEFAATSLREPVSCMRKPCAADGVLTTERLDPNPFHNYGVCRSLHAGLRGDLR